MEGWQLSSLEFQQGVGSFRELLCFYTPRCPTLGFELGAQHTASSASEKASMQERSFPIRGITL